MTHHLEPDLRAALSELKNTIPRLALVLALDQRADEDAAWLKLIELKLLPRLAPDFPLVGGDLRRGVIGQIDPVQFPGRGNVLSPTGGRAGMKPSGPGGADPAAPAPGRGLATAVRALRLCP